MKILSLIIQVFLEITAQWEFTLVSLIALKNEIHNPDFTRVELDFLQKTTRQLSI
jgi:hypothetical protein